MTKSNSAKKRQALEKLVAQGKVMLLPDGHRVFFVDTPVESWPGPDDETCPSCGMPT